MYMNTGYLNQSHQGILRIKRQPLAVGSCGLLLINISGNCQMYQPRGQFDYQIIYIASEADIFILIPSRK